MKKRETQREEKKANEHLIKYKAFFIYIYLINFFVQGAYARQEPMT